MQARGYAIAPSGDVIWADLGPPAGRRPVYVLTRDVAIEVLTALTCAPITRTTRGIHSEVEVGPAEGLPEPSVISCDNLITVPMVVLDMTTRRDLRMNGRENEGVPGTKDPSPRQGDSHHPPAPAPHAPGWGAGVDGHVVKEAT